MASSLRRLAPQKVALAVILPAVIAPFAVLVPIHSAGYGVHLALAFLLGGALCAAPVLALTHPRVAIAMFAVAAFALPVAGVEALPWPWSVPAMIVFAVLVAVVTFFHRWRLGLVAYLVILAASLGAVLVRPTAASANAVTADLIVIAAVSAGVYLVTVLAAGRLRVGEELTRAREVSATEQARRVQVEERARIARELHDVVAHSMSVIQVQASTARYRLPELPDAATAEFDALAATARESLTEMRRLLGVLRTEDQSAELAPQQGIEDIPGLVDSVRRAGVQVGLELILAEVRQIPTAVQIAAFRIVQEALSNAVRHAPGAAVSVSVRGDDAAVRLRIHNDAADAASTQGAGHGLQGMRERAALLDGTLDAGADPAGGWTVTAVLPWS